MSGTQTPSATSDHPLLDAITAFLQSPAGQAIIQALLAALIANVTPAHAAKVLALAAQHKA
jgi:hypothetical protein